MKLTLADIERELLAQPRACGEQPDLFFEPDAPESKAARTMREQSAAMLCGDCPVRRLCLAYAVRLRPEYGIWSGHTAEEIAAVSEIHGEVA
ncbi:WhiB family transcriptional regulator [Streptomonospora wellingtoniae]|uniref:Transcriptional regulator WhiB n=1 Tax=Streptomonospora wellingtoniae TaxID=3075544 RepID=A0ABU2KXU4_9ACTN|nr:WhiB family transcriptional regulator [Streptomonospora sp. DSM 45055]MDT0303997.1 WhiB family transcriptional regulator [Streptomonospora sp. DSM 45055]